MCRSHRTVLYTASTYDHAVPTSCSLLHITRPICHPPSSMIKCCRHSEISPHFVLMDQTDPPTTTLSYHQSSVLQHDEHVKCYETVLIYVCPFGHFPVFDCPISTLRLQLSLPICFVTSTPALRNGAALCQPHPSALSMISP